MASISGVNSTTTTTDYSELFESLSANSSSNNTSSSNFLADYASIKNGSYAKLTKAYYGKTSGAATTADEAKKTIKTNTTIKADADALKSSASTLVDSKTLFTKKIETTDDKGVTTSNYDYDKIYKNLKAFVDDYNKMIKSGSDSDNKSILRNTLSMTTLTKKNMSLLEDVGITINEDNTLSIDEKALKSANINDLKSLFNGVGSYADSISSFATNVSYKAEYENNKMSNYTAVGTYSASGASGNIYDSSY